MPKRVIMSDRLADQIMMPRSKSSRKGENGIMLVVGASNIYHGAPLLSSLAGLRSGVDLVYTGVPQQNALALRSFSPNIIVLPFSHDSLDIASVKDLLHILPKKPDAAAIGMGLNIAKSKALIYLINELKGMQTKLLLDASALIPDVLTHISGTNTIITPHLGEFKRVFSMEGSVAPLEEMLEISREYGAFLVVDDSHGTGVLGKTGRGSPVLDRAPTRPRARRPRWVTGRSRRLSASLAATIGHRLERSTRGPRCGNTPA